MNSEDIHKWSSEGNFDKIIEALEPIPESELPMYELLQLALSYNNKNRLQDSIDLLMTVWDIGEEDPVWNYYLGYALVFSGRLHEARECLLRARSLDPEAISAQNAEKILHYCICYDDNENETPTNESLTRWVCDMLDGEIDGGIVRIPKYNIKIQPWFDRLEIKENSTMAVAYFDIILENGDTLFECCASNASNALGAVTALLGSFYIGIYSAIEKMFQDRPFIEFKDKQMRTWKVFDGDIIGMGEYTGMDHYHCWELLKESISDYLNSRGLTYVKIFEMKSDDYITSECRINNIESQALGEIIRSDVESWQNQSFSSIKQFFFFTCDNPTYPYTQHEINEYTKIAVNMFADQNIDYNDILDTLTDVIGDSSLANELYAFIPELCASRAFEKVTSFDEMKINVGDNEISTTKWQVTSYYMIDSALDYGFRNNLFPENAFKDCVVVSSTINVISNAQDQGVDIIETGGNISHVYNFSDDYILR